MFGGKPKLHAPFLIVAAAWIPVGSALMAATLVRAIWKLANGSSKKTRIGLATSSTQCWTVSQPAVTQVAKHIGDS